MSAALTSARTIKQDGLSSKIAHTYASSLTSGKSNEQAETSCTTPFLAPASQTLSKACLLQPLCHPPGRTTFIEPSSQGGPLMPPHLLPWFKDVEAHLLPRQYQAHHCRQYRVTQGATGESVAHGG